MNKEQKKAYDKIYNEINKEKKRIQKKLYKEKNKEKIKIQSKIYYLNNKEKIKEYGKAYRDSNLEKVKARHKKYIKENCEKRQTYERVYREANSDKIGLWRKENKEKLKKCWKIYYQNNKEKRNLYVRMRMKTDYRFKLNRNISARIATSLKDGKNGMHWETIVGYTLEQLKKHIEKQFQPGMSWDNYGKKGWHIDHKIPLAVHNFIKPEHIDFKRAWALKNLQPLWAEDNLKKNATIEKPFQPSLLL